MQLYLQGFIVKLKMTTFISSLLCYTAKNKHGTNNATNDNKNFNGFLENHEVINQITARQNNGYAIANLRIAARHRWL